MRIKWLIFFLAIYMPHLVNAYPHCFRSSRTYGEVIENKYRPLPFVSHDEIIPFEVSSNFSNVINSDDPKISATAKFKLPYKVKIQSPVNGEVEFDREKKIVRIKVRGSSSSYYWSLFPIIPQTMGFGKYRDGDYIDKGTLIGLLDKTDEEVSYFNNCAFKARWVPSFLNIQLIHELTQETKIYRNPLSFWELPDYIRPEIRDVLLFKAGTNEYFAQHDNFFSKPVVRGMVQVGIEAFDYSPSYYKKGSHIIARGRNFNKLGVSRAKVEIFKIKHSRVHYRSEFFLFKQLSITETEVSNYFVTPINSKRPFLILTRDQNKMSYWNTLNSPNGIYLIKIQVWDQEGNWTHVVQEVIVNN